MSLCIETQVKRLVVLLIKTSKYDRDGYLVQFKTSVLPCNTLAAMYSLTRAAFEEPSFSNFDTEVLGYDETTTAGRIDPERIMARYAQDDTKVVVGLVGVQTNMFPRACDLAYAFKRLGAIVVMGGFHVSGSISMLHDGARTDVPSPHVMPPELARLMNNGIILFHGEAEVAWPEVLKDIIFSEPGTLYRGGRPDISTAPLPEYPAGYFDGFITDMLTMDTGRGCPFKCSFCTIINVQGNDPRHRTVEAILERVRTTCEKNGKAWFFFTDDNFARNPYHRQILKGLVRLREEGLRFQFMIEADLAASRERSFIELLAQAGCNQIFMGVESVRQETLRAARKGQNNVEKYAAMCTLCHEHGIAVHAGYIIGFPTDTPVTIREDIETLKATGFDQASFFILTPLPGSEDHARMVMNGTHMDADFNMYDSFQPVTDHPLMSREEWQASYDTVWRQFYTVRHMVAALDRIKKQYYWSLLRNFIWYRWAALAERTHPMIAGFHRVRRYSDRRPSAPKISYTRHLAREAWRYIRYVGCFAREYFVFQAVVFHSQRRRLNAFWRRYARLKWQLLIPHRWLWHLRMLRYAMTEVVYALRFGRYFFRIAFRDR